MSLGLLSVAIGLALLPGLLAVPVKVAFRVDRIEKVTGQVTVHWLFGAVRFRIAIPGTAAAPRRKSKTRKKTRERGSAGNGRRIVSLLKQSAFRRRAVRFVTDVLRATHGRNLNLRLRIGLGDPADTGRLWAFLGPVAGALAGFRGARLRIEPEFVEPVLEIESHGEFRLVPLQFLVLSAAFVLSPATLGSWRGLRHRNP